jgi:hypothetical protein
VVDRVRLVQRILDGVEEVDRVAIGPVDHGLHGEGAGQGRIQRPRGQPLELLGAAQPGQGRLVGVRFAPAESITAAAARGQVERCQG